MQYSYIFVLSNTSGNLVRYIAIFVVVPFFAYHNIIAFSQLVLPVYQQAPGLIINFLTTKDGYHPSTYYNRFCLNLLYVNWSMLCVELVRNGSAYAPVKKAKNKNQTKRGLHRCTANGNAQRKVENNILFGGKRA